MNQVGSLTTVEWLAISDIPITDAGLMAPPCADLRFCRAGLRWGTMTPASESNPPMTRSLRWVMLTPMSRRFQFSLGQLLAATAFLAFAAISFREQRQPGRNWPQASLAVACVCGAIGSLVRGVDVGIRLTLLSYLAVLLLLVITGVVLHLL